jgi:ABC-2 type transport system ATP-binding protein
VPKVVVRHLRKHYGGVEAVRDVGFDVEGGEIFGLLGPNGAGKTTTVECLIGLREPDEGAVEICGIDARRHPRAVKQKIGAALQIVALHEKIKPREALRLFAALYAHPAALGPLLDRFSLAEKADAPFDSLSGGQRQRLALALAFVNQPEIVFLDEPTAGLDPQSRRELHTAILKMKQDGHTVLLTTHYLEEAEQICDRVAIIDHGRIAAEGRPVDLIAQSGTMQSVAITTSTPLEPAQIARVPDVQDLSMDGSQIRFRTGDAAGALVALGTILREQRIEIVQLHVQKTTLEAIFLNLTAARGES